MDMVREKRENRAARVPPPQSAPSSTPSPVPPCALILHAPPPSSIVMSAILLLMCLFLNPGAPTPTNAPYIGGATSGAAYAGGEAPGAAFTDEAIPTGARTAFLVEYNELCALPVAGTPGESAAYAALAVCGETVRLNYRTSAGRAMYEIENTSDAPAAACFAFPYRAGLNRVDAVSVSVDGGRRPFEVTDLGALAAGVTVGPAQAGGLTQTGAPSRFDESKPYTLYSIRVERPPGDRGRVYVGAMFIVNVAKSRVVIDGFAYDGEPSGAARVWSLSDGFDTGARRHLYVVGEDIGIELKLYEDGALTKEYAGAEISLNVERRGVTAREYLLAFSAPRVLAAPAVTDDTLYRAYARALDDWLEVSYLLPRGYVYDLAEAHRLNAAVFTVEFDGGQSRVIEIDFPVGLSPAGSSSEKPPPAGAVSAGLPSEKPPPAGSASAEPSPDTVAAGKLSPWPPATTNPAHRALFAANPAWDWTGGTAEIDIQAIPPVFLADGANVRDAPVRLFHNTAPPGGVLAQLK